MPSHLHVVYVAMHATVHMWSEDSFKFSPTFLLILGVKLRYPGLHTRCLYCLSLLASNRGTWRMFFQHSGKMRHDK